MSCRGNCDVVTLKHVELRLIWDTAAWACAVRFEQSFLVSRVEPVVHVFRDPTVDLEFKVATGEANEAPCDGVIDGGVEGKLLGEEAAMSWFDNGAVYLLLVGGSYPFVVYNEHGTRSGQWRACAWVTMSS